MDESKCVEKVLLLSGYSSKGNQVWQPSTVLTLHGSSLEGDPKEVDCFDAESETQTMQACPLTWANKLYLFGGSKYTRQISRLDGYAIERIGNLAFDLFRGGCSAIQSKATILLCLHLFDQDNNRCRKSTGPVDPFIDIPRTNFKHKGALISASQGDVNF